MPHSSAPNILPGNAIKLPRPSRFAQRSWRKGDPDPIPGTASTAHRMLTMCCTGAHLLAKTGKEEAADYGNCAEDACDGQFTDVCFFSL